MTTKQIPTSFEVPTEESAIRTFANKGFANLRIYGFMNQDSFLKLGRKTSIFKALREANYPDTERLKFFSEAMKRVRNIETNLFYHIDGLTLWEIATSSKHREAIERGLLRLADHTLLEMAVVNGLVPPELAEQINIAKFASYKDRRLEMATEFRRRKESIRQQTITDKEVADMKKRIHASRKAVRSGVKWMEVKEKWRSKFIPNEIYENLDDFATFAPDDEVNK